MGQARVTAEPLGVAIKRSRVAAKVRLLLGTALSSSDNGRAITRLAIAVPGVKTTIFVNWSKSEIVVSKPIRITTEGTK
jgi:hypothetical protein